MGCLAAVTESVLSGCRYPCLCAKAASTTFLLGPLWPRAYDGISAFRAAYRTKSDAAAARDDAARIFPCVEQRGTTVIGHFGPGAARGFCVCNPKFLPRFVELSETSTALLTFVNRDLRDLQEARTKGVAVWSALIVGMTVVRSVEEIAAHHSPGGYLLEVERPITLRLWCLNEEWWSIDDAALEFLEAVGVTHIPLVVCNRSVARSLIARQ